LAFGHFKGFYPLEQPAYNALEKSGHKTSRFEGRTIFPLILYVVILKTGGGLSLPRYEGGRLSYHAKLGREAKKKSAIINTNKNGRFFFKNLIRVAVGRILRIDQ